MAVDSAGLHGGSACHSSSVMNGMKGCVSGSAVSKTYTRVSLVTAAAAASSYSLALAELIRPHKLVKQASCLPKVKPLVSSSDLCRRRVQRGNRPSVCQRQMCRDAGRRELRRPQAGPLGSISARAGLLQGKQNELVGVPQLVDAIGEALTRSSDRFKSWPGAVPVAKLYRSASAPYCVIASTTLPIG